MKYNKKEYLKYVKQLEKSNLKGCELPFKEWKRNQPIADKATKIFNRIKI